MNIIKRNGPCPGPAYCQSGKHGLAVARVSCLPPFLMGHLWYRCDDKHVTESNLLTLSNNVYQMFYVKEVDLGT